MRRRGFITFLGVAAATWPLAARAQQGESIRRVAMLLPYREGDAEGQTVVAAFQQRLQDMGWTEGRNIRFDIRWAGGDPDKARIFARELIGMTPDVIVPSSNLVTTIVQQETRTIPIYLCSSAIRSAVATLQAWLNQAGTSLVSPFWKTQSLANG